MKRRRRTEPLCQSCGIVVIRCGKPECRGHLCDDCYRNIDEELSCHSQRCIECGGLFIGPACTQCFEVVRADFN